MQFPGEIMHHHTQLHPVYKQMHQVELGQVWRWAKRSVSGVRDGSDVGESQ